MSDYGRIERMSEIDKLMHKLLDPDYDIRVNEYGTGFGIIQEVKRIYLESTEIYPNYPLDPPVAALVEQMLLRLCVDSPHVYAITVGQFPEFENVVEFWKKEGFYDVSGYLWLAPKPFGPYLDRKYQRA